MKKSAGLIVVFVAVWMLANMCFAGKPSAISQIEEALDIYPGGKVVVDIFVRGGPLLVIDYGDINLDKIYRHYCDQMAVKGYKLNKKTKSNEQFHLSMWRGENLIIVTLNSPAGSGNATIQIHRNMK